MRNVPCRRKCNMNSLASSLPPVKTPKLIKSVSASLPAPNSNLASADSNCSLKDEGTDPED